MYELFSEEDLNESIRLTMSPKKGDLYRRQVFGDANLR
jgi:hypothetical protein